MIRAVLDANVFVSALIRPAGPPGRILRHLVERRAFELVISPSILVEVERSLAYPRVRRSVSLSGEDRDLWIAALGVIGELVTGEGESPSVPDDPDDEKYLAAAIEGRADLIVSGDRHLLDLGVVDGIEIVSPREFLDRLEA